LPNASQSARHSSPLFHPDDQRPLARLAGRLASMHTICVHGLPSHGARVRFPIDAPNAGKCGDCAIPTV